MRSLCEIVSLLAETAGLASLFDLLNLLLQEKHIELWSVVCRCSIQKLLEVLQVAVSSQVIGRKVLHENFHELTVSLLNNLRQNLEVPFVELNKQITVLSPVVKALDLHDQVFKTRLCLCVNNVLPHLSFYFLVWLAQVTLFVSKLRLVTLVASKDLLPDGGFELCVKVRTSHQRFEHCVFLAWSELEVLGFVLFLDPLAHELDVVPVQ